MYTRVMPGSSTPSSSGMKHAPLWVGSLHLTQKILLSYIDCCHVICYESNA